MRLLRLAAITVLLLACVVLGSACAGAKGEQGLQGETGATGATGPAGPAGPAGADGTQGPQGIQGLQGLQGLQGIQGIQGLRGLPGIGVEWVGEWDNSVLYAKYDGVGYQGSSYISRQNNNTNNLPTDAAWWDLWVEKGDTGSQGIRGVQGEKGDKGDTGDQGVQGIQGAPGADGQDGAPGPNMIVAMGMVYDLGTGPSVIQDYNVGTCIYDSPNSRYDITLTGITYVQNNYVTLVTATGNYHAGYSESAGHLTVYVSNLEGSSVHGSFSFMVLQVP